MTQETEELIWVSTTRYSALMRAILSAYRDEVSIKVNGYSCTAADLLSEWCTNSRVKNARDFEFWSHGRQPFGFHDGPENFWAHPSELSFIDDLKQKRIVRYEVLHKEK